MKVNFFKSNYCVLWTWAVVIYRMPYRTQTHSLRRKRENRKWARTILKCLIGVNNLWVEVFKMLCVSFNSVPHFDLHHIWSAVGFVGFGILNGRRFFSGWLTNETGDRNAWHWNWWHFLPVIRCIWYVRARWFGVFWTINHKTLPFIKVG